ncbi:MAG: hypothetical protein IJG60_00050 [Thermoguttaceae bacterium]|nr:hypothetical protein [Thermoguttaceae bacterium]
MKRVIFLLLLLSCAVSLPAEESFKYRYWMIPAEKIAEAPWGNEKYYPVQLSRFEKWVQALSASPNETGTVLREIELEAVQAGGALSEGEGRFRFSEQESDHSVLAPCSIALSNLRWSDGTPADVGSDGTGPLSVGQIRPGEEILFSWSLAAESAEELRQQYRFELPRSPAMRLRLRLEEDFVPEVDTGLVTQLDENGLWLIEPGPGGSFAVTLTKTGPQPESPPVPPTVSEQIFCRAALEGIEITYTAAFPGAVSLSQPVTLRLDEPFLPEKLEWAAAGPADAVWEKEGRIQKIIVEPPPASPGTPPRLTLTAFAPFDDSQTLRLPPVRCDSALWQETSIGISFSAPAAPRDYIFTDAERDGATGLLRLLRRTGSVEIPLAAQKDRFTFESASRIACGSNEIRFETDLFVKADQPGTCRLTIPFKPGWIPDSALAEVPMTVRPEPEQVPCRIVLVFEQPIPTDRQLKIRINGRRALSRETLPLTDYFPLALEEQVSGEHLIALSADDESSVTILDRDQNSVTLPPPAEETVRRLWETAPNAALFSFRNAMPDLTVRFDNIPNYTAELVGRAALSAHEAREEWDIHCVPQAGSRLDQILFIFDQKPSAGTTETGVLSPQNDLEPWKITSASFSGTGELRLDTHPITDSERKQFQIPPNAAVSEVLLPSPRSTPFTLHLQRVRKIDIKHPFQIPLFSLCGASKQTGRISIVTPDFAPVRLSTRGLTPAVPPVEKENAESELASFTYDPAASADSLLTAVEGKGSRRSTWCRSLRLESDYAPGGVVRTHAVCRIENRGNSSLLIRFPKQTALVNAGNVRCGREPVFYSFRPENLELEIPLPKEKRDFTFSFDYESQIPNFVIWGYARCQKPRIYLSSPTGADEEIPVLSGMWSARVPAEFRFNSAAGGQTVRVPIASPAENYRFVSGYYLNILGFLLFLLTTIIFLQRKSVHILVFALPVLLLFFLAQSQTARAVCLGILSGCATSAIFSFFYNRPVKEPSPEESLGYLLSKRAAVFLLLLLPARLAAEEGYSVFVPTHDGKTAADQPAWIPEELSRQLGEWEDRSARTSGETRILSVLYEGQINYSRETDQYTIFRFTAKYNILTAEPEARLTLPQMPIAQEGGILIDGVAGSVTRSSSEEGIILNLLGTPAGRHVLEIPLSAEPFGETEESVFPLPVPAVPDAKLLMRLPADVLPPRLLGAMGQVSSSPGFLTADLGQTSAVTFLPPIREDRNASALLEAEQLFRPVFLENRVLIHGEFRLRVTGRISEIALQIDPRYRLLNCTADGADLIPAPRPDRAETVSIALREPVSGELTLHADFEPVDFGGVGDLPLPMIRIAGASVLSNRLQMPDGYHPSEYDLSEADTIQKSIPLAPPMPEPVLSESGTYRFGPRETGITYQARIETRGPLWQLTLRVPELYAIDSASVSDMQGKNIPFQRSGEGTIVYFLFERALNGEYQINLSLRTPAAGQVPLIGILDIPASDAELNFQHSDDVYTHFTPPGDWTVLPAGQGGKRWGIPAAAASLAPPEISVLPNRPQIDFQCNLYYYPLGGMFDNVWELRADTLFRISDGEVSRLEFRIDDSIRADTLQVEPENLTAAIDRFPDGSRRLTLTAPEPFQGNLKIHLRAPVQRSFPRLPKFDPPAARDKQVRVFLPARIKGYTLVWQPQNLEKCKGGLALDEPRKQSDSLIPIGSTGTFPSEVGDASGLQFDAFQAYKPVHPGPYTALIPDQSASTEQIWCETEYFLRSDDSYWGRTVCDLRLGTEPACEIRVPANQRILSAEADGIPLLIAPTEEENLFRIELYPETPSVRLTLTFEARPLAFQSFRAGQRLYTAHRLTSPRPANTEPSPELWTIHFDHETRHIPYYVSRGAETEIPVAQIRETFPGTRDSVPLPETGPWKRPVASDRAEGIRSRLNLLRLEHLLDRLDTGDLKRTDSRERLARWLEIWTPLYTRTRDSFARKAAKITEPERNAFARQTEEPQANRPPLSEGREEFARLQSRWEEILAQLGPSGDDTENRVSETGPSDLPPEEKERTEPPAATETADTRNADSAEDYLLFGLADRYTDLLLLTPASPSLSRATFRIGLQILAILFAALILKGAWKKAPCKKTPPPKKTPGSEKEKAPETEKEETGRSEGEEREENPSAENAGSPQNGGKKETEEPAETEEGSGTNRSDTAETTETAGGGTAADTPAAAAEEKAAVREEGTEPVEGESPQPSGSRNGSDEPLPPADR